MTSADLSTVLRRRDGLVVEGFDDALLIWDDAAARLHHLDLPATLIWDELDGRRPLGAVAATLASDFVATPDQLSADVLAVASKLLDEGLVVQVHQEP